MGNVARIYAQGGTLTFDADIPYDRQLLFEQASWYAKRQGSVKLDVDGVEWSVSASLRPHARCTDCGDRLPSVSYVHQEQVLCPRCARELCIIPHSHTVRAPVRKPPRRKYARRPPAGAERREH